MRNLLGLVTVFALLVCVAGAVPAIASPQETRTVVSGETVKVIQAVPSSGYSTPQAGGSPFPPGQVPPGAKPIHPSGKPPTPSSKGTPSKDSAKGGPPKPGAPGAPGGDDKPPGTVKRIEKKQEPADPKELEVRPGPDGVVIFQFRGQNWPDVLDWYAEIAGVSVDWLELPGDYLNISTQRGYKVEELGDLLNRLLLARGFTMLPQGEFVNVVKCEEVSSSLVPRVEPEDLEELGEYDFVRVMFDLDWMLASDAIAELDPLLSKNGKLLPFEDHESHRSYGFGSATCREIYRLLAEEQRDDGGESRLVKEFTLTHARADDVRESLSQFLGVSSSTSRSVPGMSSSQMAKQQQQMMQQMQAAMQKQMAAAAARSSSSSSRSRPTPSAPAKEMPVRMMVNARRNSLIVQAPPDKMEIISQAIKLMDVPEPGANSLQAFLGRMQVYRLASLDPQKLVTSLMDLGGLDPTTRLEVDEVNRAIIAYASPADHHTIRSTVEKLDGSARRVEVIPLRRLAADEVAGTIQYLMAGSDNQSSSQPDYMQYIYGYSSRRSSSRQEKPKDEFRIDADVANNRLLVKANEMELEEVVSILVKLGEVPQVGRGGDMTRVLDVVPGDDAEAYLQRLQRDFKMLAPNSLVLPELKPKTEAEPEPAASAEPGSTAEPAASAEPESTADPVQPESAPADPDVTAAALPRELYHTALFQLPVEQPTIPQQPPVEKQPATSLPTTSQPAYIQPANIQPAAPPIIVSIGPDGRLVISSRDARALEMLEQLATQTAPPSKDYEVFELEYALASWVVLNLEDFFEDEDEAEGRRRSRMSWMFGMSSRSTEGEERRLNKRKPLKFISDLDTNTILVQGADPQQLKTIADLIDLYDVPEPVSSQNARVTRLITVKYSRASIVANTIKDAYRDLLSSNDRALQNGGKDQNKPPSRGGGMTVISAFGLGDDPGPSDSRTSARFEGKLSIGVDDLTNTLLVSAEGENLMKVVEDMVTALDEAARPVSEVRVVKLSSHVDGSRLQDVLNKVLSEQKQSSQARAANPKAGQPTGQPPGGNSSRRAPGQPQRLGASR